MPMKPRRPCSVVGCAGYAAYGRGMCEAHAAAYDARRKDEQPGGGGGGHGAGRRKASRCNLYGTRQWQALRASHLMANPFCARCAELGEYAPATVVDHIVPHKGDRARFFDAGNLQGLCKACHDRKTAREDGGFGNRQPTGRARAAPSEAAVAGETGTFHRLERGFW